MPPRIFHIMQNSPTFGDYYDEVQELLKLMAGMDELLQGARIILLLRKDKTLVSIFIHRYAEQKSRAGTQACSSAPYAFFSG